MLLCPFLTTWARNKQSLKGVHHGRCTHGPGGCGNGDGRDEGEVVAGVHAVPQRREDEGQRHAVAGSPVVAHAAGRGEHMGSADWL